MAPPASTQHEPPSIANLSLDYNSTPTSGPSPHTSNVPISPSAGIAAHTTSSPSNNHQTKPNGSASPPRTTTTTRSGVVFRRPGADPPEFKAPSLDWLGGTWYFTHSTLPIWKDKRNVMITYTLSDEQASSGASSSNTGSLSNGPRQTNGTSKSTSASTKPKQQRLDDVVEYQETGSDKVKQVKGREYTTPGSDTRAWDWRGRGIIKVASSHWEILGWGEDHNSLVPSSADTASGSSSSGGVQWMVTYFIKTVFTPAALDFYCRSPDGLSEAAVGEIKGALRTLEDKELDRLVGELYLCKHDGGSRGKVVDAKG